MIRNILIFLLAVMSLISCNSPYEQSKKLRAKIARSGKTDVVIAVVWPELTPSLLLGEGVDLAVDKINENGGILGRRLRARHFKDTNVPNGYFDAERLAKDEEIVAVVGHHHSDATLSAMITYEYTGILLLIASASNPILLEQGFEYVYRSVPNDNVYGASLARYAYQTGYRKIAIVNNGTLYGNGLADIFHQRATELGMQIVIHRGYLPWQNDYRPLIAEIRKLDFDAVFLAAVLPQAATFLRQLRQMHVKVPVISGDALNSRELIELAGNAADGTVFPTIVPPHPSNKDYLNFKTSFHEKYNQAPDQYAILGYDIVNLLKFAMTTCKSTVPLVVGSTLRHIEDWQGIIGNYGFNDEGELAERGIYFILVRDGQFVYIKE